ncbi:40781_t:CDS:2 [Gigaspora margarita]|uniref:40781_t:CDS:1 n=1 Tax=Gigaspora margarita TaxID=4874 RepID=A0ABN7UKJ3_GIGMA|nr:40781_t:CDS:2 [Gigaspora margarita]
MKKVTQASDLHSFEIIMNKLLSENFLFYEIPQDLYLASNICNGSRPTIKKKNRLFKQHINNYTNKSTMCKDIDKNF